MNTDNRASRESTRRAVTAAGIAAVAALSAALTGSTLSGCAATKPEAADPACEELRRLPITARSEVLALARILALRPAMAIDFSSKTGEYCLNTGSPVMAHFSERPAETREDIVFFVDAAPLVARGLRLQDFPPIDPQPGRMDPDTWYRYEGQGTEPHHGMEMKDRTWLIMAVDVK